MDTQAKDIAQFKSKDALTRVALSHLPLHSFISSCFHKSTPPRQHLLLISSFSLGGMRGWRGSGLRCHLLMDGGGLSRKPAGKHKTESRAPPTLLRGCQDTVGTVCLSGTAKSLECDCQRGLRDTVPCRDGMGAIHSLLTCLTHAATVLESRPGAEGEQIRVVQS